MSLLCAGNSTRFRPMSWRSYESVEVSETENVSTWGGLEPLTVGFMSNALTTELSGPEICCPVYLNTASDVTDILVVNLTVEKLTVCGR